MCACVHTGVAQCAVSSDRPCAGVRACLYAGVVQCAASAKEKRPAEKEGGNPKQEKCAARVLWNREGRGPRALRAACVPLRAQQHRSCVTILCTRRLWVRARAAALVLARGSELENEAGADSS